MKPACLLALCSVGLLSLTASVSEKAARFYFVDIGHGNVTFVVSPSGETLLLDCGPTRAADRIYNFMQQNGIKQIDYLVITHFEDDHMGAAPALAEKVPIVNWVDHGESVTYGKSDEWWMGRRQPWFSQRHGEGGRQAFDHIQGGASQGPSPSW